MVMYRKKFLVATITMSSVLFLLFAGGMAFAASAQHQSDPTATTLTVTKAANPNTGLIALSVAVVVGMGCLGAGIAVGRVGSAALGAVSENPGILAQTLIFVGLAEGIAIYGLIVGIMLMGHL